MVDLIVRYLSFHKQVSFKGIGTFSVEHLPARIDFPNRLLHAPQSVLHFSATGEQDIAFAEWVSMELDISLQDVFVQQEILTNNFHRSLNNQETVEWEGIGNFSKDDQQLIRFVPTFETSAGTPVKADKIIRKHQEHAVRVGEDEKTSTEMEELLFGKHKRTIGWHWVFALALFLLSITAVWIFANSHQILWKKQGNGIKLKSTEAPHTYKTK